eukprot:TRINITY_DN6469_c0_g1_i1.p1 TRINITY_DN6469_c0_g1~~TRINITY_DN6469_c0_g1_i1.p1  ORF type:complete len:695 (+),score=206.71 TRINITY_DN6469_c0_g1_i1:47-2086(+)
MPEVDTSVPQLLLDAAAVAAELTKQERWLDALQFFLSALELQREHYGPSSPEAEAGFLDVAELTLTLCESHLTHGSVAEAQRYLSELEAMTANPLKSVLCDKRRVLCRARMFLAYAALKRRQGRARSGLRYAERGTAILLKLGCTSELPHAYLNLCALQSAYGLHHEAMRYAFLALRTTTELMAAADAGPDAPPEQTDGPTLSPPAQRTSPGRWRRQGGKRTGVTLSYLSAAAEAGDGTLAALQCVLNAGRESAAAHLAAAARGGAARRALALLRGLRSPAVLQRRKRQRCERLGWVGVLSAGAATLRLQCWARCVTARRRAAGISCMLHGVWSPSSIQSSPAGSPAAKSPQRPEEPSARGLPLGGVLALCYHNVAVEQEFCGSSACTETYRAAVAAAKAYCGPGHALTQRLQQTLHEATSAAARRRRQASAPPGATACGGRQLKDALTRRRRAVQAAWSLEARRMQQKWTVPGGGDAPLWALRPTTPPPGTTSSAPLQTTGGGSVGVEARTPPASRRRGKPQQQQQQEQQSAGAPAAAAPATAPAAAKRQRHRRPPEEQVPISDDVIRSLTAPRAVRRQMGISPTTLATANDQWLIDSFSDAAPSFFALGDTGLSLSGNCDLLSATTQLRGLSGPPLPRRTDPPTPRSSLRSRRTLAKQKREANRWLHELRPVPGAVY